LPIETGKSAAGQPEFRFFAAGDSKNEQEYRLIQTVVRRIRDGEVLPPSKKSPAQRTKSW